MRYFKIEILGDSQNEKLAFISAPPVGIGVHRARMAKGKRIGEHYPDDAQVYLESSKPGTQLSSFIGNTRSYLIVSAETKDVIAEYTSQSNCEIEFLPFTLYDDKKRVLSKDYWIVNPIGTFDCLNKEASQIKYLDDDQSEIVSVRKFVFDPKKLKDVPDLFRVPEDPTEYFISERLAKAFKEKGFTNIFLSEIDQVET